MDISTLKMLPARKRVYTVKDVIEAVQTGESDFEMESETSESSDEEVDEDVGPVDEQNQTPIDCPADDDEDVEATKPSQTTHQTMPRDRYCWLKKDLTSPCTDFTGPDVTSGAVSLQTPLEYFQRFVSEDIIQTLTDNTNEYSFQRNGTCLNTNNKEIEQMIGMYLKMGLMQMSGVRMYWETDTWYTPVSDVMSRNRCQSLLTSLHFVNNLTVSEAQKKDTLWKLRPCRHCDKGYTNTLCRKCGVRLCFSDERNCFLEYHCT
ncbi:uncharacterized protein LOC134328792 [Trichomycterus rosablanca]|uniref:uncharacterized protein LOC134328792 n=1 Tax=Trichomycterus rosablanca TaxID=2290929 RepID=UPI002F3545E5